MAEFFEEDVPHEEDRFARRNRHGVAGIAGTGPGCEGPAGRSRNFRRLSVVRIFSTDGGVN